MIQSCFPLYIRIGIHKVVVVAMPFRFRKVVTKLTVADWLSCKTCVYTSLVKGNGVKACEHSDIRKDRSVVFTVAVTVRADVLNQGNMEAWTSVTDCLCILCHLAAKKLIGIAVWIVDSIKAAGTDAAAAALTFIIIDNSFFLRICNSVTSAFLGTAFTATAQLFIDDWLTAGVLSHFSGTLPQPIPMFLIAPPKPVAS